MKEKEKPFDFDGLVKICLEEIKSLLKERDSDD